MDTSASNNRQRELTLTDRSTGIEARVVIERDPDGPARVVDIRLRSTDGHGLRSEDLLVLEELGLRMPVAAVDVVAQPALEPAPKKTTAKKTAPAKKATPKKDTGKATAPTKAPAKAPAPRPRKAPAAPPPPVEPDPPAEQPSPGGRVYRQSPPLEELDALYRQHDGSPSAMADALRVPRHTMNGWLKRHRNEGHEFRTAAPAAVGG